MKTGMSVEITGKVGTVPGEVKRNNMGWSVEQEQFQFKLVTSNSLFNLISKLHIKQLL